MEIKIKHGKYSGSIRWVRGHQLISDGEKMEAEKIHEVLTQMSEVLGGMSSKEQRRVIRIFTDRIEDDNERWEMKQKLTRRGLAVWR